MAANAREGGEGLAASKRERVLSDYMQLAKKKSRQKKADNSASRSSLISEDPDPLAGQVLISIGRMEFDSKRARGVLDKKFPSVKIAVHKDSSAADVINKCQPIVWGDPPEKYKYFLADGSGSAIGTTSFDIELPSGSKEVLPWTLDNYLKISKIKYPSRLRLYCVRSYFIGDEEPDSTSGSDSDASAASATRVTDGQGPEQAFEVMFSFAVKSKYRNSHSFRSVTQQNFLAYSWDDENRMLEVREEIESNPDKYYIFIENPLEMGHYLHSIEVEEEEGLKQLSFIESLNMETGKVDYVRPSEGAIFDIWAGCKESQDVALLVCVAINGYHGVSNYLWSRDGQKMQFHSTPLLYCDFPGSYTCVVSGYNFSMKCSFVVKKTRNKVTATILTKDSICDTSVQENLELGESVQVETSDVVTLIEPASVDVVTQMEPEEEVETESIDKENDLTTDEVNAISKSCDDPESPNLLSLVGSGAFGQVFKAVWRGTIVAAKVILSAGNEKIVDNELRAYQTLHHPNILTLVGIVRYQDKMILLTNFVSGKNLYQLLHDSDKKVEIPFKRKVHIMIQVTQALVYMHSCTPPVVHLDLKPENVLVEDSTYHVCIADFGLGKILTNLYGAGRTTMQAGTPAFQPPEQLMGEVCGVGSDVYALGCMIVEMFGGKPIWENLLPNTIILKVAGGHFPSVQHVLSPVKEIAKLCLVSLADRAESKTILKALCQLLTN